MEAYRIGNFPRASLAAFLALVVSPALAVSPGATKGEVIEELGPPPNRLSIGTREILDYERGRVELDDGVVVRAELISGADAAERRRLREDASRAAAEARKRQQETGRGLRDAARLDPAFLAAPAEARIAYWETFSRTYPGVPVAEDLARARLEHAADTAVSPEPDPDRSDSDTARLEARIRALERERLLLETEAALAMAPVTLENRVEVNVNVESPLYEPVLVAPVTGPRRPAPPPAPADPLKGRYSGDRRYLPIGSGPIFGGPPKVSPRP